MGKLIEDRGSQVTFSALGQQAPLAEKEKWNADFAKRKNITAILEMFIPKFSIRMGGATSTDVTKPGIRWSETTAANSLPTITSALTPIHSVVA